MVSDYKQAFLIVMEGGEVFRAVVMGEDSSHGEGLAISETKEICDGQIWATAPFPVVEDLPLGVRRLKP